MNASKTTSPNSKMAAKVKRGSHLLEQLNYFQRKFGWMILYLTIIKSIHFHMTINDCNLFNIQAKNETSTSIECKSNNLCMSCFVYIFVCKCVREMSNRTCQSIRQSKPTNKKFLLWHIAGSVSIRYNPDKNSLFYPCAYTTFVNVCWLVKCTCVRISRIQWEKWKECRQ